MNFEKVNPENADQELLDDFFEVSRYKITNSDNLSRFELGRVNKILNKYGYLNKEDGEEVSDTVSALNKFKKDIDSDISLTWRRMKLEDLNLFQ
jgi:hypothetical protein